jgi:hypothetical protein
MLIEKEVIEMITLKSIIGWLQAKAQDIRAWIDRKVPVAYEKGQELRRGAQEQVQWFCTSPLSGAEYALLRRGSAIVGTAVALYLVVTAGLLKILMVAVLSLCFAWLLHRFFGDASPGASIPPH